MIQAVIEIGTNSTKLSLAKREEESIDFFHEKIAFTRIGENFFKRKVIAKPVLQKNIDAIQAFIAEAKKHQADRIAIIATQALRQAENADEFATAVTHKTGLPLSILTAKEEAYFSYLAAFYKFPFESKQTVLFDIGGGSTELFGEEDKFAYISVPIGVVSVTEQFRTEFKDNDLQKINAFIHDNLKSSNIVPMMKKVMIGIGGTVVTMQKVNNFLTKQEKADSLTKDEIESQIEFYVQNSPAELVEKIGLPPLRADVILAGALIVLQLMKLGEMNEIKVCKYGVRHGFLMKELEEK